MEVKANVQRRRQSRIRELQSRSLEHGEGAGGPGQAEASGGQQSGGGEQVSGLPLYMRGQQEAAHGGDPEVAWKERQRQLLAWYAEEERRDPGDGGLYTGSESRDGGRNWGRGPFFRLFRIKLILAFIIFAAVWGIFRWDSGWAREVQAVVAKALTQEMDFSQAAAWYQKTFSGAPSFLPAFGDKQNAVKVQGPRQASLLVQPVRGTVVKPYSDKQEGIWIAVKPSAQVAAMDQGRVEFAGEKQGTGYTVIVRHSDGIRATYGGLSAASWQTGDWVKAGEVIGSVLSESGSVSANVFLAVMKDDRYLDPLDVVTFD